MRDDDRDLLERAREAARYAYAPYSRLQVGAAVRARDGRVFTGANVENASYPLGICAERSALAAAVSAGLRPGDLESIAVTASPCGGWRRRSKSRATPSPNGARRLPPVAGRASAGAGRLSPVAGRGRRRLPRRASPRELSAVTAPCSPQGDPCDNQPHALGRRARR
ncbi:MAG: cytidine deaminase [Thermoleophilia bacterium]